MYHQFNLSSLCLILGLFCTALAVSNGPRHLLSPQPKRRAATLSEFLTPPAPPPINRNNRLQQTENAHFRHGKILMNSPVQASYTGPVQSATESPGYFARFMGWLNPFGGSPTPQQQQQSPDYQNNYNQQNPYGSAQQPGQYDAYQDLPRPPSPPTGQSYSPPLIGSNCNPCNSAPWIPIEKSINQDDNGYSDQPPILHIKSPSQEVRIPDFASGNPSDPNSIIFPNENIDQIPKTDFPSPITGPIPNPHLFPGAIPPLFHAVPFHDSISQPSESKNNIVSYNSTESQSSDRQSSATTLPDWLPYPKGHIEYPLTTLPPQVSGEEYVDVLPPGAEITATDRESFPPNHSESSDNKASSSDINVRHFPFDTIVINQDNLTQANKLPTTEGTKIHIQESPLTDLTQTNHSGVNDSTGFSPTGYQGLADAPIILQGLDGNATWPDRNNSQVTWPTGFEVTSPESSSPAPFLTSKPTTVEANSSSSGNYPLKAEEIGSILINVFNNSGSVKNDGIFREKITTQQPYGTLDVMKQKSSGETTSQQPIKQTTEQHFLSTTEQNFQSTTEKNLKSTQEQTLKEAIIDSYDNFLKSIGEISAKEKVKIPFNPKDIHPGAGFSFANSPDKKYLNNDYDYLNLPTQTSRRQGSKKYKQVQIIIPYTSQYNPAPFKPQYKDFNEAIIESDKKKPVYLNKETVGSSVREIRQNDDALVVKNMDNLMKLKNLTGSSFGNLKVNTSIDPLRLQKNIDNWTILEYSTVSTEVPSSLRPQLFQSKSIPDDYLTTTEPITIAETIREPERSNVLTDFNYHDLEQEGSASDIRVSSFETEGKSSAESETRTKIIDETEKNFDNQSWKKFSTNLRSGDEDVFVVTPQSISRTVKLTNSHSSNNNNNNNSNNSSNSSSGSDSSSSSISRNNNNSDNDNISKNTNGKTKEETNNPTQFDSIERAYQVLPEAVNNLAVASTGPGQTQLWGIMEHEQYASIINNSTTLRTPILYSGHSKVSHAKRRR